jgi:mitogen-activated protein kinase 1/3
LDLYLSTEYCDQGDLFHMKGQLGAAEVQRIMWQLLQAVQYLHNNGVWHRDIKTANIYSRYLADGSRWVEKGEWDLGCSLKYIADGARWVGGGYGLLEECGDSAWVWQR